MFYEREAIVDGLEKCAIVENRITRLLYYECSYQMNILFLFLEIESI